VPEAELLVGRRLRCLPTAARGAGEREAGTAARPRTSATDVPKFVKAALRGYGVRMVGTGLPLRVLVIGLDPYRVPGPWDPAPVARAIESGIARFVEHGVGVQCCLVGLDGGEDIAAVIGAALRDRAWECVVIGGGIRSAEDQLDLFEQVVNLVRRHAPGAAIAFNRTAEDTYQAAARWIA
jgi:hypothetical protein